MAANVVIIGTFFILLAAKVFGFITWSWWWITAPLWVPTAVGLLIVSAVIIFAVFVGKPVKYDFRNRRF